MMSANNEVKEKRKLVRFRVSLYFKYRDKSNNTILGITRDVTRQGLRLLLEQGMDTSEIIPGENIELSLFFSNDKVHLQGKVVWINNYPDRKEVGLYFSNPSAEYIYKLFSHIRKYHPYELSRKNNYPA